MMFGNTDYYYVVTVEDLSADKPTQNLRFHTETAARAEAKAIAEALDDAGIVFDIDVYYVDIDHQSWLTGYCNDIPEA